MRRSHASDIMQFLFTFQDQLFVPMDVIEERGLINVAFTIQALVDRVRDTKQSAV